MVDKWHLTPLTWGSAFAAGAVAGRGNREEGDSTRQSRSRDGDMSGGNSTVRCSSSGDGTRRRSIDLSHSQSSNGGAEIIVKN